MNTKSEQIAELKTLLEALKLSTKLLYTKAETSRLTGLSTTTLDRMNKADIGMERKKILTGDGKNGRIMYPISEIARFYFESVKETERGVSC